MISDSSSSINSINQNQISEYPRDWKCFHLKIQSWFYASLGTLCCFCTIRIADYILTLYYLENSTLSRFHGILAFDILQVLSIILLGAYGTYRMNSKLVGTYLMVQVSFLAVNGALLVYWVIDRVTSKLDNNNNSQQVTPASPDPNTNITLALCVQQNQINHMSYFLCIHPWTEVFLTLANESSCIMTLVFGALVLRMSYMVNNKDPKVIKRRNNSNNQHYHNNPTATGNNRQHVNPHRLLDESMTNIEDSQSYLGSSQADTSAYS